MACGYKREETRKRTHDGGGRFRGCAARDGRDCPSTLLGCWPLQHTLPWHHSSTQHVQKMSPLPPQLSDCCQMCEAMQWQPSSPPSFFPLYFSLDGVLKPNFYYCVVTIVYFYP